MAEAIALFAENELDAEASPEDAAKARQFTLAGRVMSLRGQGALIFFNFFDDSAVEEETLLSRSARVCHH